MESVAEKAEKLRSLHAGPDMLVLANVWDAAGARLVAARGFSAIATTSSGVAGSLGYEDGEKAPVAEMLAAGRRIVNSVDLPVTVDFESGYGLSPKEIVHSLVEIGATGLNFEDTDHASDDLFDASEQADRISAIRTAATETGVNLIINARVDSFIRRVGTLPEQITEGLRRAHAYKAAGADCIYPILLTDETAIAEFVNAVKTINLNVRPNGPISLKRASELGVRRVSYAVSVYSAAATAIEDLVDSISEEAAAIG